MWLSCWICSRPRFNSSAICGRCLSIIAELPVIERAAAQLPVYSLLHYVDGAKELVGFFKNGKNHKLAGALMETLMGKVSVVGFRGVAGVIPSPADEPALKDHAWVLAEKVAEVLGVPLLHSGLQRVNREVRQKSQHFDQRAKIEFAPLMGTARALSREGGVYVLVDDVITTGFTMQAFWKSLGEPPALGLTLASTPLNTLR